MSDPLKSALTNLANNMSELATVVREHGVRIASLERRDRPPRWPERALLASIAGGVLYVAWLAHTLVGSFAR